MWCHLDFKRGHLKLMVVMFVIQGLASRCSMVGVVFSFISLEIMASVSLVYSAIIPLNSY